VETPAAVAVAPVGQEKFYIVAAGACKAAAVVPPAALPCTVDTFVSAILKVAELRQSAPICCLLAHLEVKLLLH
jgi:hypothetical protein